MKTDVTWTETLTKCRTQIKEAELIMSYFFLAYYFRLTKCVWDWAGSMGSSKFQGHDFLGDISIMACQKDE